MDSDELIDHSAVAGSVVQRKTGASDSDTGLPSVLRQRLAEEIQQQLVAEYRPVGVTETVIVADLARRAAANERWGVAAMAIAGEASRSLPELASLDSRLRQCVPDAVIAAAMTIDSIDRCDRQSLLQSRAFYRGLQLLLELQARRKSTPRQRQLFPFEGEAACEAYLARRFEGRHNNCPKCMCHRGYYLQARKCWQCSQCNTQIGLRSGTVMARSAIPLMRWFMTIWWLLSKPTISTTELAEKIGLNRPTTVRLMVHRIRGAMCADDASERLAHLDLYFSTSQS